MENKIIVGNIKMNLKFEEISNYLNYFKNIKAKDLIICPSYIYIPYFLNYDFSVGSQNVAAHDMGAYTGEVSAEQLYSIGVKYTIIGHSELRNNLGETDDYINKKIINTLNSKLKVILCIGETLEEKKLNIKYEILNKQIKEDLKDIKDLSQVILAYEPVWSVGTNKLPTEEELIETIKYIKQLVQDTYKQKVKVIYGGSINENNIINLNKIKQLDGFLIGSASINPSRFIDVINKVI